MNYTSVKYFKKKKRGVGGGKKKIAPGPAGWKTGIRGEVAQASLLCPAGGPTTQRCKNPSSQDYFQDVHFTYSFPLGNMCPEARNPTFGQNLGPHLNSVTTPRYGPRGYDLRKFEKTPTFHTQQRSICWGRLPPSVLPCLLQRAVFSAIIPGRT